MVVAVVTLLRSGLRGDLGGQPPNWLSEIWTKFAICQLRDGILWGQRFKFSGAVPHQMPSSMWSAKRPTSSQQPSLWNNCISSWVRAINKRPHDETFSISSMPLLQQRDDTWSQVGPIFTEFRSRLWHYTCMGAVPWTCVQQARGTEQLQWSLFFMFWVTTHSWHNPDRINTIQTQIGWLIKWPTRGGVNT